MPHDKLITNESFLNLAFCIKSYPESYLEFCGRTFFFRQSSRKPMVTTVIAGNYPSSSIISNYGLNHQHLFVFIVVILFFGFQ